MKTTLLNIYKIGDLKVELKEIIHDTGEIVYQMGSYSPTTGMYRNYGTYSKALRYYEQEVARIKRLYIYDVQEVI